MSFLTERITNYLDNITRDPVAEAKKKAEQDEILTLIKTYKEILKKDREDLLNVPEIDISDFDRAILTELNNERSTLLDNKAGLTPTEFQTKWTDLTDKFNSVLRPKDNGAKFWRHKIGISIKVLKQCAQDVKTNKIKVSEDNLKSAAEIKEELIKFQNDNAYTDSGIVFVKKIESIQKRYTSQQITEFTEVCKASVQKLNKNKQQLDFQETGGAPVPAAVLEAKAREEALKKDKEQDTFSASRMFMNILQTTLKVFFALLVIFLVMMGSSFAVNLNIYKPYPFRILYAIYGAIFAIIVVPYTLLYRWVYLGKKPKYYGFIPLIPRFFVHRPIQFLFGWLTYKPDAQMWELEEWRQRV